ncbi:MAG: ice-binding family protein, partial [Candidatus Curtissbacteria bacterium]
MDGAGPTGSINDPGLLTVAKNDLITAYDGLAAGANADANCLDGLGGTAILADNTDLRTLGSTPGTLGPGVYCSAGNFLLTDGAGTDLTLSGSGPWVFRAVSGIIVSNGASVVTAGNVCDVWWRAGSSATIGTTVSFVGN